MFRIISLQFFLLLSSSLLAQWNTTGNFGTNPTTNFLGTTDQADLRIRTNDTLRVNIDGTNGFVGLANLNPLMRLHVDSGGILVTGDIGDNPNLGAGTRMMFVPSRAAFRTGGVSGNQWDSLSVGELSFASGANVTASGRSSFTLGAVNVVTGVESFAFGQADTVLGESSGAIGKAIRIDSVASYAMGCSLASTANFNLTFGLGLGDTKLTNSIPASLMVGFISDIPTLFVGPSSGPNTFGRVGLGNITSPTELLDVNGNARFRQLPDSCGHVLITGVEQDSIGDYALRYFAFPANGDQFLNGNGEWTTIETGDCDWIIANNVGTQMDVFTGTSSDCEPPGNVGIGTINPGAKLDVLVDNDDADAGANAVARSMRSVMTSNATINIGLDQNITGATSNVGYNLAVNGTNPVGIRATVQGATNGQPTRGMDMTSVGPANSMITGVQGVGLGQTGSDNNTSIQGVWGRGSASGAGNDVFGVRGIAEAPCGNFIVGIYGEAIGNPACSGVWAGYFVGDAFATGLFQNSDEMLKSDIQDIPGSLEIIGQLNPKQYHFQTETYPQLNLPAGQHRGLIAQEVQTILPELVKEVHYPGRYDEEGNVLAEPVDFLSVNYQEFIPLLIGAVQEQQSQINALTELVNSCCSADAVEARSGSYQDDIRIVNPETQNRLDQNAPNPFTDHTTLRFSLAKDGQARVCIYNSNGQLIDCLIDGNTNAGEHSLIWNTSDLAPGIYFYSLEVDGFEQVRRAVKL